jgi:hypothetical protein
MAKRKKQAGRPTKVENEGALLLQLLSAMNTITDACAAAGVGQSTYRLWLKMGQQNPSSAYGDFCRKLETAKARAKATLVAATFQNAMKDGNLGLRLLERKFPEDWGKPPEHIELTGKKGSPPVASAASDPAVQKMLERFRKMDAERLAEEGAAHG